MKKIIISAILATLMLFILVACGEKGIPAQNFINITLSGTEGDGKLTVGKNYYYATALAKELKGDGFTDYDDIQFQMLLSEACKIEVEGEKEGLSNGDKVTIKLNYSEEAFADVGVVISPSEYTYTVEGLTDEPQKIEVDTSED
jgi:hypothetical protein